jgi:phosphoglycolate phosphatase
MSRARIVFDLDGTLIDSAPDIQGIANALLEQEGAPAISLAQTHDFIGKGVGVFVERLCALRGLPASKHAGLTAAFVQRYMTAYELTKLYPGVREMLDGLGGTHSLGICTNKVIAPCHAVLKHLNVAHHFGTVIGGDSLPTRKPDPEMLHAAFDGLGSGPRIYVGDSEVDAETAQRAGVPFLLFTAGYRKSPIDRIPHDAAFDSHAELEALVARFL